MDVLILLTLIHCANARVFCEKAKMPLEVGEWKRELHRMDTATIENRPVTMREGQMYVYENHFPNRTIKYIHVDNLAVRTCGASAAIKSGGVGTSSVLVVLHSAPYQEVRSVIDVWGTAAHSPPSRPSRPPLAQLDSMKSLYLFKNMNSRH